MARKLPEYLSDMEYSTFTANARLMAFSIVGEVRHYRLRKGWTQTGLARVMGVTQSTISEWETGVIMPQLDSLMKLCILLEIPFLFGDKAERVDKETPH